MDGQRIWADLFGPPFDRYGERILLAALVGGSLLGALVVGFHQPDWLWATGAEASAALGGGALIGAMAGLPLVALSSKVARRFGARARAIFGAAMLLATLGFGALVAQPLLLREPTRYGSRPIDATYQRTWRRGGAVVRQETIAGTQLAAEEWVKHTTGVVAGASCFGLLAMVPLALGLLHGRAWVREREPGVAGPLEDESWWVRLLGGRCPNCARIVLERWRRCPSCSTLLPRAYAGSRELDVALDQLSMIGVVAAGFGLLACAVLAIEGSTGWAWLAGSISALGALIHVVLRFSASAWRPVRVLWSLLTFSTIALLWGQPRLAFAAASVPATVTLWLLVHAPRLAARARERRPDPRLERLYAERCTVCNSAEARLVAPMWVISAVFVTVRRPGAPDVLCPTHARLKAIPATVVSALLGWWGIPWGLLWTPGVLVQNLSGGGVELDRGSAVDVLEELQEGPLAVRATSLLVAVTTAFVAAFLFLILTAPVRP
jgi:hypothetical protein